jgi:hypothetical protein
MVTPLEMKVSIKFGLTVEEVATLAALGFDTPRKIKDADPEEIPEAILAKLSRWHPQE